MSVSGTAHSPADFASINDTKRSQSSCGLRGSIKSCFKPISLGVYLGVLLWRFIGLILFSIHAADCLFREKHASYRCKNFTIFSYADELEVAWQTASVINALTVIVVLVKVPGYQGYLSALRNNSKHARFWSLFFQLVVAVISKIVVICTGPPIISKIIEVEYIFMEVSAILVVYLWNGVSAPWKITDRKVAVIRIFRVAHAAYLFSLFVFTLENFSLFLITSAQAAFQVTGLYNSRGVSSAIQVIAVVLNTAEALFYYALMKFFWNKWFDDKKNLLINDNM